MNLYKIIFARNEVISCKEENNTEYIDGSYHYEHKNGKLIYALIKAESEDDARSKALVVIKEVTDKIFGTDYV